MVDQRPIKKEPYAVIGGKAKAVGINHVVVEVDDIDTSLAFYGHFLEFEIGNHSDSIVFIYFGDQFIKFSLGRVQAPDNAHHFGISVDDKELVRETLIKIGVELINGRFLNCLDPWGNRIEITRYTNVQFSKDPHVLQGNRSLALGESRRGV